MGIRVLIVDDDPICRMILERVFSRLPEVEVVAEATPGGALLRFAATPGGYQLVITDYQMPEMNGIELAVKLLEIRADIPIIAISATPGKCRKGPFIEVLAKPVKLDRIDEFFQGLLRHASRAASAHKQAEGRRPKFVGDLQNVFASEGHPTERVACR